MMKVDFREINNILFIPAKSNLLPKVETINADAFILDLEDSIAERDKIEALNCVYNFLKSGVTTEKTIFVRVNKNNYLAEITKLADFNIGFVLPKLEHEKDYFIDESIEKKHSFAALIESPLGIINITQICNLPWISAIMFGAEDYTSVTGKKNDYRILEYEKNVIVLSAKAFRKYVYDTPCFDLSEEYLLNETVNARDIGFDGKLAIHPKQLQCIRDTFLIKEYEEYERIVETYEKTGEAVVKIDGKIYEKMHIDKMKNYLGSR